jgi:hypothetical protein
VLSIAELLRSPGMVYTQLQDRLLVRAFNQTAAAVTLAITGRLMLLDGQVIIISGNLIAAANAVTPLLIDLAEGFLLDLTIGTAGAAFQRGTVIVQAGLARGVTANFTQGSLLISGYPAGTSVLGWPFSTLQNASDGQGFLSNVAVGNPAAGADWTYTVPAGLRQRFIGAVAQLTASAAVANRTVILVLDDGTNTLASATSPVPQTASQAIVYEAGNWPYSQSVAGVSTYLTFPPGIVLMGGSRVRVSTVNLQAADQWSVIRVYVESWVDSE